MALEAAASAVAALVEDGSLVGSSQFAVLFFFPANLAYPRSVLIPNYETLLNFTTMLRGLLLTSFFLVVSFLSGYSQSVEVHQDSLCFYSSQCPTPVSGFFTPSGTADNLNSVTDSIIVQVFWGDGSNSIDTVELFEAGTADYWSSYFNHTYNFAGINSPMVVATSLTNHVDTGYATQSA